MSERGEDAPNLTRRQLLGGAAAGLVATTGVSWWSKAAGQGNSKTARQLRQLARSVRGPVVTRSNPGIRVAGQLWNSRFSWVVPLAVVYAVDERDVQETVRWAARTGTRITARSGGHSYEGYSTTTSGVVLDISNLSGIDVNVRDQKASIGAGAQLVGLYNTLAERGQTIPGGTCPTVGIAGLALGGGLGLAGRRWGTTSDNILALRIVTAEGRIRTVDRTRDPDLYWACRGGGGGNFGVVTRFLFRTYPADPAVTFELAYNWDQLPDVVAAWQQWAPFATPDIFSLCSMEAQTTRNRLVVSGQYFGDASDLAGVIAPLTQAVAPTNTVVDTKNYIEAVRYWATCTPFTREQCERAAENPNGMIPRPSFAAKSDYVRAPLPSQAGVAIQQWLETRLASGVGVANVIFDAYGGAINEVAPTATAFAHRDMLFSIQYNGEWTTPSGQRPTLQWLESIWRSMRPYVTGSAYVNYIDAKQPNWLQAYYGQNAPRLIDTKDRYDPDNVFRFAQSIPRT
jgi:FAD/FMN-containing dehydrogenase